MRQSVRPYNRGMGSAWRRMFQNQKAKANGDETAVMATGSSVSPKERNSDALVKCALPPPPQLLRTTAGFFPLFRAVEVPPIDDTSDDDILDDPIFTFYAVGGQKKTGKLVKRFDGEMFDEFVHHPHRFELMTKSARDMDNNFVYHGVVGTKFDGHLFGVTSVVRNDGCGFLLKGEYAMSSLWFSMLVGNAMSAGKVSRRQLGELFSEGKLTYLVASALPELFAKKWRPESVPGFTTLAASGELDGVAIENISFVLGFVHAVVTKNKMQILFYVGQRVTLLAALCTAFAVDGVDGLVDYFERSLPQDENVYEVLDSKGVRRKFQAPTRDLETAVLEKASQEGVDAAVDSYGYLFQNDEEQVSIGGVMDMAVDVPKLIVSTKWLQNLSLLSSMAAASSFFGDTLKDYPNLMKVLSWVSPTGIIATAGVTALVMGTIKLMFEAFQRVRDTKNILALFSMDEEVEFRLFADEHAAKDFSGLSDAEVNEAINFAASRASTWLKKKFLSRELHMAIQQIRDKNKALTRVLESEMQRVEPSVVFLLGEPGAGKTVATSNMLEYAARADGREKQTGDSAFLTWDTAFMGENLPHPGVRNLIMNDVPDDTSQASSKNRVAIDTFLQQVLDTAPLSLQHPEADKKGDRLTKVCLLIMNSNYYSLIGAQDTKKLVRRISRGFNYRFTYDLKKLKQLTGGVDEEHKQKARDDFAILNSVVVLKKQVVTSSGRHICFEDDDRGEHRLHEVQKMFVDWYVADRARSVRRSEVINRKCSAGYGLSTHYRVDDSDFSRRVFQPCCDGCVDPHSLLEESEQRAASGLARDITFFRTFRVVAGAVSFVVWKLISSPVAAGLSALLVAGVGEERASRFLTWGQVCGLSLYVGILDGLPVFLTSKYVFRSRERARSLLGGVKFVRAVKNGWRDHRITILAITGAVTFGILVERFNRVEPDAASPADQVAAGGAFSHMREVVPPGQYPVLSTVREMTYPESTVAKWRKVPQPMPVGKIEFFTLNANADDIQRVVNAQVFEASLSWFAMGGTHRKPVRLTFWNADFVSLPTHSLHDEITGEWIAKEFFVDVVLPSGSVTKSFTTKDVHRMPCLDVALIRNVFPLKTLVPLNKFLFKSMESSLMTGLFKPVWAATPFEDTITRHPFGFFLDGYRNVAIPMWVMPKDMVQMGDCGTPLISFAGSRGCAGILGVVSAKSPGHYTGFTRILYDDFEALVAAAPLVAVGGETVADLPRIDTHAFDSRISGLLHLSERSVFRERPRSGIVPLGTLPVGTNKFQSRLTATSLRDAIEKRGVFKTLYVPPKALRSVVAGEYFSAFDNMYGEKSNKSVAFSEWVGPMFAYYQRVKPLAESAKLAPLTFQQALFGDPVLGIDPVNKDASNGGTLTDLGMKTKIDLFLQESFRPEFIARFDDFVLRLKTSSIPAVKVHAVPKDELRPIDKVNKSKVRLFMVMDFHVNLHARAYLAPLFKLLQEHPFVSCVFSKINAASPQWDELARWLNVGKNGDGDYSKFDVNHAQEAFLAFAMFMRSFAKASGYTSEEADDVYRICIVVSCQILVYQSDVALKTDGMPSGWYATLMFNCFVNILLHLMAWRKLTGRSYASFFDSVNLGVVGDDNVWGLKVDVPEWNVVSLVSCFSSFGYPATSGSKTGELQPYVSFRDLGFLKRKFKESGGTYYGPLESDSLWKALCYEEKKVNVVPLQRTLGVIQSFQREAFLHGEEGKNMIVVLKEVFGEVHPSVPFPEISWEQLQAEYSVGMITYWSAAAGEIGASPLSKRTRLETVNHSPPSYASSSGVGNVVCDPAWWVPTAQKAASGEVTRSPGTENCVTDQQSLNSAPVAAPSDNLAQNSTIVAPMEMGELGDRTSHFETITDEYKQFVSQPVQTGHLLWTAASPLGILSTTDDVVADWFTQTAGTAQANRITNFARFTADIKIKLVVQGAPQLYGSLVVAFDPGRTKLQSSDYLAAWRADCRSTGNNFVVPHIVVDPSVSQAYELTLPMVNFSGFYTPRSLSEGSWRMTTEVINPLRTGTASTATVSVCYYMSFENVKLDAMFAAAGPVTIDGVKENSGKVSGLARGVAKISQYAGRVFPAFSPFTSALSVVGNAAADVLSFFGFAKPVISHVNLPMLTRTTDAYSHNVGVMTAQVLGSSQDHSLSIDATFGGGDIGQMDLRKLCAMPGLIVEDFPITTAVAAFARLALSIPVSPMLTLPDALYFKPTPMGGCAFPHLYWAGDITLCFEFVASVFQRATVLIAWNPTGLTDAAAPTFDQALTQLHNTTVQVSGRTKVEITVPWRSRRAFCRVGPAIYTTNAGNEVFTNGRVYIWVINPVVSNGSTDPIGMNVWARSENLILSTPSQSKYDPTVGAIMVAASGEVTSVYFGSSNKDSQLRAFRSLGDVSVVVKDVISRHCHAFRADQNATNVAVMGLSQTAVQFNNYPMFPNDKAVVVSNAGTLNVAGVANLGTNVGVMTHLAWFTNAFNGFRGSISWSVGSARENPNTTTGAVFAPLVFEHHPHGVGGTTPVIGVGSTGVLSPTITDVGEAYSYTVAQTGQTARADAIAPVMVPYPLVPAGTLFVNYTEVLRVKNMVPTDPDEYYGRLEATCAAGDDYVLVFFRGFPAIGAVFA